MEFIIWTRALQTLVNELLNKGLITKGVKGQFITSTNHPNVLLEAPVNNVLLIVNSLLV